MPSELNPQNKLPYTVAFLLPMESQKLISLFHRKLSKFCLKFDEPGTAHLTVKYLGFATERFTEEYVTDLIPRIAELAAPFLPFEVSVRGLDMFNQNLEADPVVYLKVLNSEKLHQLHLSICEGLGTLVDYFPHADGDNYRPHITISKKIEVRFLEQLIKVVFRSKKTSKRHFTLTDLVLLTPLAIYPIVSKR